MIKKLARSIQKKADKSAAALLLLPTTMNLPFHADVAPSPRPLSSDPGPILIIGILGILLLVIALIVIAILLIMRSKK
jgi:hypothetical protein